jgi:class I fructose-bisphosphate aldolase
MFFIMLKRRFHSIRQDKRRCPKVWYASIVWAYPRGEAIETKGGRDSLYAVDYATRVANELGADMVKVNIPEYDKEKSQLYPEPYKSLRLDTKEALEKIVKSAGRMI